MVARIFILLTFVLAQIAITESVYSAPSSPNPDFNEPLPNDSMSKSESLGRTQSLDISPAPATPVSKEEPEIFYRYRQAIGFHLGMVYDRSPKDKDGPGILSRFGAQYLFPIGLQAYEAGADLFSDGTGLVQINRRWIFSKVRFRPYVKAGGGIRVDPKDQLATFLKLENYQLRGAIGFEDLLNDPTSFRMEFDAGFSGKTMQLAILFGGVWAW